MRVALVLYGDLDFISGGFLYDRMLVEHLRRQGEAVEIVSLPWRPYAGGLLDNLTPGLMRPLTTIRADIIVQDELAHPSLLRFNRRLQPREAPPWWPSSTTCAASEPRPAWQNKLLPPGGAPLSRLGPGLHFQQPGHSEDRGGLGGTRPALGRGLSRGRPLCLPPRPGSRGRPGPRTRTLCASCSWGTSSPGRACTPSSRPWPSSPGRPGSSPWSAAWKWIRPTSADPPPDCRSRSGRPDYLYRGPPPG